jgi:chromodomain-containing protein
MDLIADLSLSEGHNSVLTIVDQGCSKAANFLPCRKAIDSPGIARLYLAHLVLMFRLPKQIISDSDLCFASQFATTLCKALGTQQNLSTTFHPRTDGQTERMNTWLEQYLRPWCASHLRGWAQLLPIAEYMHNSWKHDTLKITPHELITGMRPSVNMDLIPDQVPAAQERLQTLQDTQAELQKCLEHLQMVKDNKRPPQLTIGQRVWLEGCNLHVKGPAKLLPKRYGPFQIMQKIGNAAYQLDLPPSIKVHDVFHIDLLTPYKEMEEYRQAYTRPPPITVQSEEKYEVKSILQARHKGLSDSLEYKDHWKGYPSADDSWVPHDDLHSPDLLKEFYTQGEKVLAVKRKQEWLQRLISSLLCLLLATVKAAPLLKTSPPLSITTRDPPWPCHRTVALYNRYSRWRSTLPILSTLSPCFTPMTRVIIVIKNAKGEDKSYALQSKSSVMTMKQETPHQTSLTRH